VQADGETLEFHCGEQTRRPAEESYVHSKVGSEGGKMILNVESKRHQGALRHAHTKPELRKYSPFGPHNSQTRMGGTFGLRQLLPSIFSEPDQVRVFARVHLGGGGTARRTLSPRWHVRLKRAVCTTTADQ
jgi:hypothetical protein